MIKYIIYNNVRSTRKQVLPVLYSVPTHGPERGETMEGLLWFWDQERTKNIQKEERFI